jgi:uncharacterized membrane protein YkvA (DUF1232 family)
LSDLATRHGHPAITVCAITQSSALLPTPGSRPVITLADRLQRLREDVLTLWFCCRHPGMPRSAKLLAVLLVAYAFSPIDLIPDFIPVLGYLDELILLPLGIWLTLRLIPPPVVSACREQARAHLAARRGRPRSRLGLALVIAAWCAAAALIWWWLA